MTGTSLVNYLAYFFPCYCLCRKNVKPQKHKQIKKINSDNFQTSAAKDNLTSLPKSCEYLPDVVSRQEENIDNLQPFTLQNDSHENVICENSKDLLSEIKPPITCNGSSQNKESGGNSKSVILENLQATKVEISEANADESKTCVFKKCSLTEKSPDVFDSELKETEFVLNSTNDFCTSLSKNAFQSKISDKALAAREAESGKICSVTASKIQPLILAFENKSKKVLERKPEISDSSKNSTFTGKETKAPKTEISASGHASSQPKSRDEITIKKCKTLSIDKKAKTVTFDRAQSTDLGGKSETLSTDSELEKTVVDDESGNSLRSSPHGRLRMRNRSLSGGSEDSKQRKTSVPQIAISECLEHNQFGRASTASSEKESSGVHDDELDQVFAYHSRSQMSLSSFGGRSESVTSVYSAAGGGRYGTVTVTGEVLFGLSYNYKTGALEINIKECRNLAPVDTKRNRSDPYVKIYLLPDRTKSGKRKTKVKKHTLSPVFDELLKFQVTISELETRTLWLSVWHSDRFGRNDFLGEVMLPLGYEALENSSLKWFPLQERLENFDTPVSYKGDLILSLKYVPPDVTSRKHPKKPGDQAKGALHVLVVEAKNLMATRSNGTSDPFCKSYLLPDKSKSGKQKTPVFKKSCNPNWNHTFVYDNVTIEDLRERCLELTVWDYDKITSNDFLGGVRLCLGTGKYQGREVEWMDSVGEEVSLWYTMLERPNTWVDGSLLLRPTMQSRRTL